MKLAIKILNRLKNYLQDISKNDFETTKQKTLNTYFQNGQIPWSEGYVIHKKQSIIENINNTAILKMFTASNQLKKYGYRLDERIVEYPWILSQMEEKHERMLDAGSTFNFDFIVDHPLIKRKELTIFTYAPESPNYNEKRISYVYGDLRDLPFKDAWFDIVVSQSTIEHIDMDNSIYGYEIAHHENIEIKSYEFLIAVKEMIRVLKPGGTILLTFPYGKFEQHGFFQQFDNEMVGKLLTVLYNQGSCTTTFFKYLIDGWYCSNEANCNQEESFNPHTNKGKGNDGAAHSRSICCIRFEKNQMTG